MANRYLIASGAFTSTSIWSATYGGSGGASVPVSGDIIQVDTSYNITSGLPSDSTFDFIVYLGNNNSSSVTLGLGGSPIFRSLIIQSKNSAAHTVNFDSGSTITASKFIALGSSVSNKLTLGSGSYSVLNMQANGTCYGQYVNINGLSANGSSTVPHYIGSGSVDTYSTGSRPWLLQDPPKISTLVDPLTTDPASNTNWTVTGTVTAVDSGHDGGGYDLSAGGLLSTDTYDVTSSQLIFENIDSADYNGFSFEIPVVGSYLINQNGLYKYYIDSSNYIHLDYSSDGGGSWSDGIIDTVDPLQFKSSRLQFTEGASTLGSINPTLGTVVTKTQSAIGRISKGFTKTQSGKSRVQISRTKTQTGKSRISKNFTKTITGVAKIKVVGQFTQTGKSRITNVVTKTQPAIGRISRSFSKTQTAKSYIVFIGSTTQTGMARIATLSSLTQAGKASIQEPEHLTQTGMARIQIDGELSNMAIASIATIATTTQIATARLQKTFTKTQTAVANIRASKSITGKAYIISNPPIPKSYLYKVYSKGVYLGLLPTPTNDFGYSQDINTSGTQISVTVPVSADTSSLQGVSNLTDESGNDLTDESGNILTTEGAVDIVGVGADSTLIKNGNHLDVWEYSQYYPNGTKKFSGEMSRFEAGYGGDGGQDSITILAYSDGQDLDNLILSGSPFIADQSQTTQNTSTIVQANSHGGYYYVGQTFTVGSSVTNIGAIDLYVADALGSGVDLTVSIYPNVTDANNGSGLLGSVTKTITNTVAGVVQFAFVTPITITSSTQYFMTVTTQNGLATINYSNTNPYSGGGMYSVDYSGTGGSPSYSSVSGSDLYFKTYHNAGSTTAVYDSVDPSTGLVEPVIDSYNAQGGSIHYTSSTIDATGLSLSYTFNTSTVYDGIQKALDLSPDGFYWYADPGSNLLYFKNASSTADIVLTKGKHLSNVTIIGTIENIKNILYFTGGLLGTGYNLFTVYRDNDSIAKYGPRLDVQTDNRVTIQATADAIGNSFIATNSSEQQQTTVTILDTTMDINLLKLGMMVGFNGFGTFVDNLILQIVHIDYSPDSATLTLGILPPRQSKNIAQITRNLIAVETIDNPSGPSA